MDNQLVQLIVVIAILTAIGVRIIFKLIRRKNSDTPSCPGCSMAENCKSKNLVNKSANSKNKDCCRD